MAMSYPAFNATTTRIHGKSAGCLSQPFTQDPHPPGPSIACDWVLLKEPSTRWNLRGLPQSRIRLPRQCSAWDQ